MAAPATKNKRRSPARRRKRPSRFPLGLALLGILAAGGILLLTVKNGAVELPSLRVHKEPPEMPDYVTEELIPVNTYSRPGTRLEVVNGVVIHYVGNPGTSAQNNRDYFASLAETGERSASSHFVVGLDGEVLQCVPLDEIAYCSNNRNGDTISIEVCHPDESGKFTDASYQSVVRLTRFLADYYDLRSDDIIRHYDVTGKLCPLYYVEHEDAWEQMKQDIFR